MSDRKILKFPYYVQVTINQTGKCVVLTEKCVNMAIFTLALKTGFQTSKPRKTENRFFKKIGFLDSLGPIGVSSEVAIICKLQYDRPRTNDNFALCTCCLICVLSSNDILPKRRTHFRKITLRNHLSKLCGLCHSKKNKNNGTDKKRHGK